jgi:hypothetical protein
VGNNRSRARWGQDDRRLSDEEQAAIAVCEEEEVETPAQKAALDAQRTRCLRGFKAFYDEIIAQELTNRRTGKVEKQVLGRVHDFLIDFLNLNELGHLDGYSGLKELLPEKDEHGDWKERWFYWPTLDVPPEIQDGPDGHISEIFYGRFWQGLIIRVKGDGLDKCTLMPRGHLKSTVGTQVYHLWRVAQDASERHIIETATLGLATDFVMWIKAQCEGNEKLKTLFPHLSPPQRRDRVWNTEQLKMWAPAYRGREATFTARAVDSEQTGGHCEEVHFDDVVGEKNYGTEPLRNQVDKKVQHMQTIRDPQSGCNNTGTRWHEEDSHGRWIAKDSDASFLVCTVLDADESVPVSRDLTPLGYGKPIYPEKWSIRALERLRKAIQDSHFWFGQMFNQFFGSGTQTFDPQWKVWYEGSPELVAEARHLDIFIGIDTASGFEEKKKSDLDYTAGVVLGQTPDRREFFILDGFQEKLGPGDICKAIVDLFSKWQKICTSYGGTLRGGVEEIKYTHFLHTALDYYQRLMGIDPISIEPITIDARSKIERIRMLAYPYSQRRVRWPRTIMVASTKGGTYDFMRVIGEQFDKMGPAGLSHEDALDAHARAYEMAPLAESTKKKDPEEDVFVSSQGIAGVDRYLRSRPPLRN